MKAVFAASENKILPVHRWVPWIAGFSAQFVEDCIETYLPKWNRSARLVLDPFAGVATTMVEALKVGCDTIGYEINPFAALAARAKVNCVDVCTEHFKTEIEAFRSALRLFENEVDRRWREDGDEGIAQILEELHTLTPK